MKQNPFEKNRALLKLIQTQTRRRNRLNKLYLATLEEKSAVLLMTQHVLKY